MVELNTILYIYLLSLVPSFEGRYALLTGVVLGLSPGEALIIASLGVLTLSVVLPQVLFFIDSLVRRWDDSEGFLGFVNRFYHRYVERTRIRASKYMDRYGFLGLVIFVAIPLPGTGVWTGSLASFLLGLDKRKTVLALVLGGLLSNAITYTIAFLLS